MLPATMPYGAASVSPQARLMYMPPVGMLPSAGESKSANAWVVEENRLGSALQA